MAVVLQIIVCSAAHRYAGGGFNPDPSVLRGDFVGIKVAAFWNEVESEVIRFVADKPMQNRFRGSGLISSRNKCNAEESKSEQKTLH